jgi:phage terminase small subunit
MSEPKLTPQQRRFALEYVQDLNGTQAAIRAGYSENCATEQASRLLTYDGVRALVDQHLEARQRRSEITADSVLSEIHKMAFAGPADLLDADGRLIPLQALPKHVSAAITGLKITTRRLPGSPGEPVEVGHIHDFKFEKIAALEKLMKHLGLYERDNKQKMDPLVELMGKVYAGSAGRIAPADGG